MSSKKRFLKHKADRKIKRLNRILISLILIMTAVVLYDSIIHETPLYYIGFMLIGLLFGRVFSLTQRIEPQAQLNTFTLRSSRLNIVLVLFLISLRFVFGKSLIASLNVVWATDALYLFFIGVYRARWKNLIRQIDGLVYNWVEKEEARGKLE
jgi:hypothetical protein